MADITTVIDRGIPSNERVVVFTQADGGTGDVLLVEDSLGKPATKLTVDAPAEMTIRFNVYRMVYPPRKWNDDDFHHSNLGVLNLALGERAKVSSNAAIVVEAGETLELDLALPVKDIEIVAAAGAFTVTAI